MHFLQVFHNFSLLRVTRNLREQGNNIILLVPKNAIRDAGRRSVAHHSGGFLEFYTGAAGRGEGGAEGRRLGRVMGGGSIALRLTTQRKHFKLDPEFVCRAILGRGMHRNALRNG